MNYIEGKDRYQGTLFPEVIDDYITNDNPVRVIDIFVDRLDLFSLGFKENSINGRPSYNPKDMLKLYIYGYFNKIRSSRNLEKETQRNIELMWLLNKLTPDNKTISRFRKDNAKVLKNVF
ncbi:MAG: transposase [Oscillospiraceae bacterium]